MPGPAESAPARELARRERWSLGLSLLALALLTWAYLWYDAAGMMGGLEGSPSGRLMILSLRDPWDPEALALGFLMWGVMMVGMMLPGALPTILFFAALWRRNRAAGKAFPSAWLFTAGYLLVWLLFSLAAVALQAALQSVALLDPMLRSSHRWLTAGLLAAAGLYQVMPAKSACLRHCQAPLQFFMTHWHAGRLGALRMGVTHGLFCLGCCWAIMLLLFATGVMNLAWVAILGGFVLLEKLAPPGWRVGRVAGVLLLAAAVAALAGW